MQAITVPWKMEWKIIKALTAVSFEYKMDAWVFMGWTPQHNCYSNPADAWDIRYNTADDR